MMLGPMKKRLITTGVIAFIIPTVVFVGIFAAYSKNKNEEIATLETQVATVPRWIAKTDMPIGHIITSADIETAEVKEISAPVNSFETVTGLIGEKLKVPVYTGTIMTSAMFYEIDDKIDDLTEIGVRSKEFNMISLPSDLNVGDYIDVRILFPTGEDYIVIKGKEVKKVGSTYDSSAIFLDLTEEEINRMSSAVVESYMSEAINLYAVKYSDWYEQLYDEYSVDYVQFTNDAIVTLIEESKVEEIEIVEKEREPLLNASGDPETNESGEIIYKEPETEEKKIEKKKVEPELTNEEVLVRVKILLGVKNSDWAKYTNLTLEDVEAIRKAIRSNDEPLLALYKQKSLLVETRVTDTYPVRKEVATVIANNPNILDELKVKYGNIEEMQNQRENIELYAGVLSENTPYDEYQTIIETLKQKLDAEISTQKSERSEYLQSLVRQELINGAATTTPVQ